MEIAFFWEVAAVDMEEVRKWSEAQDSSPNLISPNLP